MLYALASVTALSGFAADFNRTHLFNPAWTAHAKFHDAMTISHGLVLGLLGLYFLARRAHGDLHLLKLASLFPAIFWASMVVSFFFPGVGGLEADFPDLVPVVAGMRINELPAALFMLLLIVVAALMARPTRTFV
ncbi:DUF6640 family protein [Noviherbaspirillum aerium]|uniref:DUF6640 family protein n=1 Tax=Noviherbaspirillum aerium TaxID=2588497 RepID=UPI00124E2DC9|nr:DUF6640 family protein [Noviherbaspirillum aerium]